MRAIETADGARTLWSDADRAWATRAAAEVVGEAGGAETFLARRATLAIDGSARGIPRCRAPCARCGGDPGWASRSSCCAFALGVLVDRIGGGAEDQRAGAAGACAAGLEPRRLCRRRRRIRPPVRRRRNRRAACAGQRRASPAASRVRGAAARFASRSSAFADDWTRCSGPLYGIRAARILHVAAAALAAGVVAGLYLRGIAFEYRATGKARSSMPRAVRAIVAVAYAPGALLTGLAVPGRGARSPPFAPRRARTPRAGCI